MDQPTFNVDQFVDALSFNTAMSGLSNNSREYGLLFGVVGLSNASVAAISTVGLVANSTLNAPFAVLFGDGTIARAHGTQNNQDTQSYSTSFSGIAPVSGSITGYLLASLVYILQNPVQIVGPPPGHPDYNPNFTPYTAYLSNVASLSLLASTTPADNSTTFELARYSVTPTSLTSGSTAFQNVLSFIPVGTIMDFTGPTPPGGWLVCDGSAVSRTTYAKLNALAAAASYALPYGAGDGVTTFDLPDLRGYFRRGWNSQPSTGPDAGRTFGTVQASGLGAHNHNTGLAESRSQPNIYSTVTTDIPGSATAVVQKENNAPAFQATTSTTGGSETRGVNVALLTCIKY